jgi:hypothetical protein
MLTLKGQQSSAAPVREITFRLVMFLAAYLIEAHGELDKSLPQLRDQLDS